MVFPPSQRLTNRLALNVRRSFRRRVPGADLNSPLSMRQIGMAVFRFGGAEGFISPVWLGYPSASHGDATPLEAWLLSPGYRLDTDVPSGPNGGGVSLQLACAHNLSAGGGRVELCCVRLE